MNFETFVSVVAKGHKADGEEGYYMTLPLPLEVVPGAKYHCLEYVFYAQFASLLGYCEEHEPLERPDQQILPLQFLSTACQFDITTKGFEILAAKIAIQQTCEENKERSDDFEETLNPSS